MVEVAVLLALLAVIAAAVTPWLRRARQDARMAGWRLSRDRLSHDPSLVAHFLLYEGRGPYVRSLSGDPTLDFDGARPTVVGVLRNGVRWHDGRWPRQPALFFDGTDDYADLGAFATGGPGERGLTLLAWFKPLDYAEPNGRLVAKAAGPGGSDLLWALGFSASEDGPVLALAVRRAGVVQWVNAPAPAPAPGDWHLAAGTCADGEMRLYLDGVLVASAPCPGPPDRDPTARVWLGEQPPVAGTHAFGGWLDEVAVFSRALPPEVIADAWHAGRP